MVIFVGQGMTKSQLLPIFKCQYLVGILRYGSNFLHVITFIGFKITFCCFFIVQVCFQIHIGKQEIIPNFAYINQNIEILQFTTPNYNQQTGNSHEGRGFSQDFQQTSSGPPYKVNEGVVLDPIRCYLEIGPLQKWSSNAKDRVKISKTE